MIILYTASDKYYSIHCEDTIDLVKKLSHIDLVIRVFNDKEGLSPHEYISDYELFIHNDSAVISKQEVNVDSLTVRPVVIEQGWKKKVIPTIPMTGSSFYTKVFDLNREGQMLEDYFHDNYKDIIDACNAHLEKLNSKIMREELELSEIKYKMRSTSGVDASLYSSLYDLSSEKEKLINEFNLEIEVFQDFISGVKFIEGSLIN